jgi:hypothetical protein
MGASEHAMCDRCEQGFEHWEPLADAPTTCPTCRKLGDRSLVWLQLQYSRADTDEQRAELLGRFRAAYGLAWTKRDIGDFIDTYGAENLPWGIIQRERERRRDA